MSTRISKNIYQWAKNIQFCLLPPECILCRQAGSPGRDLCNNCRTALPTLRRPCLRCALPLPPGVPHDSICGTCLALPPPFQRLLTAHAYESPVTNLVAGFKYHGRLVYGRVLAQILGEHILDKAAAQPLPDLLVPVPLHRRRLRQRGFNQSLEVARWLAKPLDLPVRNNLVIRHKSTPQQTDLSAAARRRNLRGAFRLKAGTAFPTGAAVAIIDDVVTTGSTVTELARVLRRAGAREVHVWALARTVL